MAQDQLSEIAKILAQHSKPVEPSRPAGIGSKAKAGMFGAQASVLAEALRGNREQTSARVASIASRGLDNPASLSLDEIRTVCASALTQTAGKG